MARVERRLNTLIRLENVHCGHEELVRRASDYRTRFEDFLAAEIEAIVRKAGLP